MLHLHEKIKCSCGCEYCPNCHNGCPQCKKGKINATTTTTNTSPRKQCICACHDNKLKRPYAHSNKCCDEMNGFVGSRLMEEFRNDFPSLFFSMTADGSEVGNWWEDKIHSGVRRWVEKMWGLGEFTFSHDGKGWEDEEEVIASIISYIEG